MGAAVSVALVASVLALAAAPDPGDAQVPSVTPVQTWHIAVTSAADGTGAADVLEAVPVVVHNGGNPFIAIGDRSGRMRAFNLASGSPVSGWATGPSVGFPVRAPLSSDGTNVFVPVSQANKDQLPKFAKYGPNGSRLWITSSAAPHPSSPANGFQLGGMALANLGGTWRAFAPSSGHWVYGINGANGAREWDFRIAESTMATPAVANLYGSGSPQVIFSNNKSAGSVPGNRFGGHLRIMTASGGQICSAVQVVTTGGLPQHRSSGYNNSSPIVAEIEGRPLIVFGTTASVGDANDAVVAYDSACNKVWESPRLAGRTNTTPSFADVLGTGTPQVVQVVERTSGSLRYPQIYLLDARNGAVLAHTGTSLASRGSSNVRYTQASQIVTADVNADGRQDLIVAANQILVIDGATFGSNPNVIAAMPLGGAIQNTPVVTADPQGGVRITWAGYSGNNPAGHRGSFMRQYRIASGVLGERGWHQFGANPQRTGLFGSLDGPYDQLLEGRGLASGASITSRNGQYRLTMQADGNLVLTGPGAQVRWSSGTSSAGATLSVGGDGRLQVRSTGGTLLWQSGGVGGGVERLVVTDGGTLEVLSSTFEGVERTARTGPVWSTRDRTPNATLYVPVTPCRLVDTRLGGPGALAHAERRSYVVSGGSPAHQFQGGDPTGCGIPDEAVAAEVTLTATDSNGRGYARLWPSDRPLVTATAVSYRTGNPGANTASIQLSALGATELSLENGGGRSHYVLDVQGYYVEQSTPAAADAASFVPVEACRIVDTRYGSGRMRADTTQAFRIAGSGPGFAAQGGASGGCQIPVGAIAAEMSVSAVGPTGSGYVRAWASGGAAPGGSHLNYRSGLGVRNTGPVELNRANGQIALRNFRGTTNIIIDVRGYWMDRSTPQGSTGSAFVPVNPCRIVDTRVSAPRLGPGETRAVAVSGGGSLFTAQGGRAGGCAIPVGSAAVELSTTAADPVGTGFIRAWPAGQAVPSSSATLVNYTAGLNATNTAAVAIRPTGSTHLAVGNHDSRAAVVADVLGYYVALADG